MPIDPVSNASAAALSRIPPGLARRELELPPGQAARSDDKPIPAGIAKRFPATQPPVAPAPAETEAASQPGGLVDASA